MDKGQLWVEYKLTKDNNIKQKLIEEYLELVHIIASKTYNSLGCKVDFDDLYGYGVIGLIHSIERYDIESGNKFETYASLRIKGSMYDFARKKDFLPRDIRKRVKDIQNFIVSYENTEDKTPTYTEIASELGITVNEVNKALRDATIFNIGSLEEAVELKQIDIEALGDTPESEYAKKELKSILVKAIDSLKENERLVISLYYYDELMIKEIADVLNVSISRVSQIHSKALKKIKGYLQEISYIDVA